MSRKCPGRVTSPAKRATRPTGRWRAARPARRACLAAARLAARARSPLRRRTAGTSPPRRPACLRHGHAPVSAGKTASARGTRKRVRRNTAEHRYSRALSSASWRTGYAASLGQHAAAPRVIAVEAVLGEGAPGQAGGGREAPRLTEGEGVKRRAARASPLAARARAMRAGLWRACGDCRERHRPATRRGEGREERGERGEGREGRGAVARRRR